ncbi:uncharacterized protein LOC111345359 [Stylophora pistillata]|uniref:uncharacterized protein LOC111345359 n=1 Tax=Stylophora pistillata TaxID=50429 RepID=UPI000C04617B|nr:uncharacterized protein LOC111345359 [Stylophora pistillata]
MASVLVVFRRRCGPCLALFELVTILLVYHVIYHVREKHRREIRFLTYNIWNSPLKMRDRMVALGEIVQDLEPDVITFQEVTLANLAVLREQRWFSRYHLIPQVVFKSDGKHFVIILSVFPVEKWLVHPFSNYNDSTSDRRLVFAEVKNTIPSSDVIFGFAGTHLAYRRFDSIEREQQLKESFHIISPNDNVCVMGDLNINDNIDGEVVLPPGWFDVWLLISGNFNRNGFTYDREKISIMKGPAVNAKSHKARYDRVFCKLLDFKVKEMRIVGDEVTRTGIFPSDHFGLFVVIQHIEKPGHEKQKQTSQTLNQVYFKRPKGWEKLIK